MSTAKGPAPTQPKASSSVFRTLLSKVTPALKAVGAAVVPLVVVSLTQGSFNWKSILAAGLTAVTVYFIPNFKLK